MPFDFYQMLNLLGLYYIFLFFGFLGYHRFNGEINKVIILLSPLGKITDRAIYFACVNFFLSIFLNLIQNISGSTGPIFMIFFRQMVGVVFSIIK